MLNVNSGDGPTSGIVCLNVFKLNTGGVPGDNNESTILKENPSGKVPSPQELLTPLKKSTGPVLTPLSNGVYGNPTLFVIIVMASWLGLSKVLVPVIVYPRTSNDCGLYLG